MKTKSGRHLFLISLSDEELKRYFERIDKDFDIKIYEQIYRELLIETIEEVGKIETKEVSNMSNTQDLLLAQYKFIKAQCKNNRFYRDLHIRDITENLRQLSEISMTSELEDLTDKEKVDAMRQVIDYYMQHLQDKIIELEESTKQDLVQ